MSVEISGNRTIAKNSLFLYMRMILLMFVSLISVRIIINSLGVENYGIYSAIGGVTISFSFLSQTLIGASQRFFSIDLARKNYAELNNTFNAIILSYIIIAIVIFILLETIGLWFVINKMTYPASALSDVKILYQLTIFTFLVTLFSYPLHSLIIANEDMKVYAYVSLLEAVLKLAVAAVLVWLPYSKLRWYGALLLSVSLIVFVIYYAVVKSKFKFLSFSIFSGVNKIKEILNYSSWTLLGTLAGTANTQGVNLMLNLFFGPIANAAYSIGTQISNTIAQVAGNFFSAVKPPLTKSFILDDKGKCINLFYFSNKVLIVLLSMIVIPLYIEMPYILKLWIGNLELYMISFSRQMLVNIAIIIISYPITTLIQAAGAVKRYHMFVDGFALVALPLVYISLVHGMCAVGAFWITNGIFILAHIIRLFILKTYVSISIRNYLLNFILPSLLIILITVLMLIFLQFIMNQSFFRLCLTIGISVILQLFLSYSLLLSETERNSIRNLLINKLR